jgi:hypothetical protein
MPSKFKQLPQKGRKTFHENNQSVEEIARCQKKIQKINVTRPRPGELMETGKEPWDNDLGISKEAMRYSRLLSDIACKESRIRYHFTPQPSTSNEVVHEHN